MSPTLAGFTDFKERARVPREATRAVLGPDRMPTTDLHRIEHVFHSAPPHWDPNADNGRECLLQYRQILLQGLRAAARKPTDLTKIHDTVQGPKESPAAFLERLYQAYRLYSPIDPEAIENQKTINMAFVSQSAPDLHKKLQKLEGFEGKLISELVEIAQRVFQSRDSSRYAREGNRESPRSSLGKTPRQQQRTGKVSTLRPEKTLSNIGKKSMCLL